MRRTNGPGGLLGSVESPFETGEKDAIVTFICLVLWLPLRCLVPVVQALRKQVTTVHFESKC